MMSAAGRATAPRPKAKAINSFRRKVTSVSLAVEIASLVPFRHPFQTLPPIAEAAA
jgi:hypothetical protein